MGKQNKFIKVLIKIACILAVIFIAWIALSLIGRVDADKAIPDSAALRLSVHNTIRFIDKVMDHESVDRLSSVPSLAQAAPFIHLLHETNLHKNFFVRLNVRGKLEIAQMSASVAAFAADDEPVNRPLLAVYDLRLLSPLARVAFFVLRFLDIPDLYYVRVGKDSRFEYRTNDGTFYITQYRNLLYITDSQEIYESRSAEFSGIKDLFKYIDPSDYDAVLLFSDDYAYDLFSGQDTRIAETLNTLHFNSMVEAGLSIEPRNIEFRLVVPLSSEREVLSNFLDRRSQIPNMAEQFPASVQYATTLSAGTLEELYHAAIVFAPDLEDTMNMADGASRSIVGMTLDELLFSWSGNEFAVFGMEGRPHPVFAVQITDDRKRQEVFDKAFRSIFLTEDVRLSLDGVRMPRIATPPFLQFLLEKWGVYLPSPYYTVYRDFLLVSESADTLLAALRAMQRNDVLPRTVAWREITAGRGTGRGAVRSSAESAFSLYYSLDLSVPFFLRNNTNLTAFLSLYRQGLIQMSFDRGLVNFTLSLVPGSGHGVTLAGGYPLDISGRPSNQVFGTGRGTNGRVFIAAESSVFSVNLADNSIYEFEGQGSRSDASGTQWIIPVNEKDDSNNAWVVSDRGRVTLVDDNLEAVQGFPVLTGLRLTAPPKSFNGKLYLCSEDGRVHTVDENGSQGVWETSFNVALRSPPSFLSVSARSTSRNYAAVYPKSFFGEIWLLDAEGKAFPNWPAPITVGSETSYLSTGLGFGTPLLFAHNNNVYAAFICQTGELLVYDENASRVSPFPLILNGVFYLQPVFDGEYLWLVSSEGNLFRIGLDGELLYQNIAGLSVMEEGYITTFDYDGDGTAEIFITGEGNALYAFTRNFRSLEGFPLPIWGRPHFVEAQNNGRTKAQIIGIGMDRRLYRWQFR